MWRAFGTKRSTAAQDPRGRRRDAGLSGGTVRARCGDTAPSARSQCLRTGAYFKNLCRKTSVSRAPSEYEYSYEVAKVRGTDGRLLTQNSKL